METKSTWGGLRPGSGRPRKEKTVTLSFRVKESEAKQIKSQILKIIKK
jgi:hypothetical protein